MLSSSRHRWIYIGRDHVLQGEMVDINLSPLRRRSARRDGRWMDSEVLGQRISIHGYPSDEIHHRHPNMQIDAGWSPSNGLDQLIAGIQLPIDAGQDPGSRERTLGGVRTDRAGLRC